MKHPNRLAAELFSHPFQQRMLEGLRPLLLSIDWREAFDRTKAERLEAQDALSPAARYLHGLLNRTSDLMNAFNRIDLAATLLTKSPRSSTKSVNSIDRNEWSDYHFLAFSSAASSIVDCSVLLVAEAYRLGIPYKRCTFEAVTENLWVAGQPAKNALIDLRNKLRVHVERRNRYLHRGERVEFDEVVSDESNFWKDVHLITYMNRMDPELVSAKDVSRLWRIALSDMRPILIETLTTAANGAARVMTAVQPVMERSLTRLGSLS